MQMCQNRTLIFDTIRVLLLSAWEMVTPLAARACQASRNMYQDSPVPGGSLRTRRTCGMKMGMKSRLVKLPAGKSLV